MKEIIIDLVIFNHHYKARKEMIYKYFILLKEIKNFDKIYGDVSEEKKITTFEQKRSKFRDQEIIHL